MIQLIAIIIIKNLKMKGIRLGLGNIPKPEILFCLFGKIVKFCVRIAEGNI